MLRRASIAVCVLLSGLGAAASIAPAQDAGAGGSGAGTAAPGSTADPSGTSPSDGSSRGTREQQTFPRVRPRAPTRASHIAVYFTLADQPGHEGVIASDYLVQVDAPAGARAACRSAPPPAVDTGTKGAVVRVALSRPVHGWCRGRYRVTVYLQRGPYCPEPAPGQPPQPCPAFASQDLDVGDARFAVGPAVDHP